MISEDTNAFPIMEPKMAKLKRITQEQFDEAYRKHRLLLTSNFYEADEGSVMVLHDTDFTGMNLDHLNLTYADLSGSSFVECSCKYTDFTSAKLANADFRHADLFKVNFDDAVLRNVNFSRASIQSPRLVNTVINGIKLTYKGNGPIFKETDLVLKDWKVCLGLYDYQCWAVLDIDNKPYVRMGCLFKSLEEWEKCGGIRASNEIEYPDNGSEQSERRVRAFEYMKGEALAMKHVFEMEEPNEDLSHLRMRG